MDGIDTEEVRGQLNIQILPLNIHRKFDGTLIVEVSDSGPDEQPIRLTF